MSVIKKFSNPEKSSQYINNKLFIYCGLKTHFSKTLMTLMTLDLNDTHSVSFPDFS